MGFESHFLLFLSFQLTLTEALLAADPRPLRNVLACPGKFQQYLCPSRSIAICCYCTSLVVGQSVSQSVTCLLYHMSYCFVGVVKHS